MYDLNLNEELARQWILDVENEINNCKDTLRKVSDASSITPDEEDTILNGIKNACDKMGDLWNRMCDGFSEAKNKILSAIDVMVKGTETAKQDIDDVSSRVGS